MENQQHQFPRNERARGRKNPRPDAREAGRCTERTKGCTQGAHDEGDQAAAASVDTSQRRGVEVGTSTGKRIVEAARKQHLPVRHVGDQLHQRKNGQVLGLAIRGAGGAQWGKERGHGQRARLQPPSR